MKKCCILPTSRTDSIFPVFFEKKKIKFSVQFWWIIIKSYKIEIKTIMIYRQIVFEALMKIFKKKSLYYFVLYCISEFTQDAASKGLSLVYEQSTAESRKDLVSILVDTLMTGKR